MAACHLPWLPRQRFSASPSIVLLRRKPSGADFGGKRRNSHQSAVFGEAGNGTVVGISELVRVMGLEPISLAALEPKSSMFTNFIIPAYGLPTCAPKRHGLSLLQHAQRPSPAARGLGPACHASRLRAEEAKPPRVMRTTAQRLQATPHFCPDRRAKGRAAMQAACNRAKWAHFSDSQHARHGGPGPRVMQPARWSLRASNCTATCATTAPPRLRNQCRDSRRP